MFTFCPDSRSLSGVYPTSTEQKNFETGSRKNKKETSNLELGRERKRKKRGKTTLGPERVQTHTAAVLVLTLSVGAETNQRDKDVGPSSLASRHLSHVRIPKSDLRRRIGELRDQNPPLVPTPNPQSRYFESSGRDSTFQGDSYIPSKLFPS